jgi:hypothetical protein
MASTTTAHSVAFFLPALCKLRKINEEIAGKRQQPVKPGGLKPGVSQVLHHRADR